LAAIVSLFREFFEAFFSTTTAMSSPRATLTLICLLLVLLPAGCRRGSTDRLPVHGTVKTAAGEQLNASITFLPSDGQKRPAATASVKDGVYHFDRTNGPTAGPTRVIVTRLARREESFPSRGNRPVPPAQSEWRFALDLSDDGRYLQDFTLKN
jgi:hypothetical protein